MLGFHKYWADKLGLNCHLLGHCLGRVLDLTSELGLHPPGSKIKFWSFDLRPELAKLLMYPPRSKLKFWLRTHMPASGNLQEHSLLDAHLVAQIEYPWKSEGSIFSSPNPTILAIGHNFCTHRCSVPVQLELNTKIPLRCIKEKRKKTWGWSHVRCCTV